MIVNLKGVTKDSLAKVAHDAYMVDRCEKEPTRTFLPFTQLSDSDKEVNVKMAMAVLKEIGIKEEDFK